MRPPSDAPDAPDDPAAAEAPAPEQPSKTQRKHLMHALQELGEQLVALPRDQLARLDLPEPLRDAVEAAQRITSHEGRRRQLQYVGRLMRSVDAEPIRDALERRRDGARLATAQMHRCEQWRDRLLDDDGALTTLLRDHPGVDVPWLRATIRAARRERAESKPPRHARELYRWLRQQMEAR
jgi:ribosome-associated protein